MGLAFRLGFSILGLAFRVGLGFSILGLAFRVVLFWGLLSGWG